MQEKERAACAAPSLVTGAKLQKYGESAKTLTEKIAEEITLKKQKAQDRHILPLDGLRGEVREIITHFTASTKSCSNFVAASVLTTIGATAGTGLKVVDGSWANFGQLYTMLYGSPSDSKTPAIKPVVAPLDAMESHYLRIYHEELEKYKALAKGKGIDPGPAPLCKQLLVQNATPEAIIDVLDKNRRGLLVVADEAYNFFRQIDKYNNGGDFVGQMTETWSNSSLYVNRKGEDIRKVIREPFLAFLGGIQKGNLKKIFPKYDGTGFIERWSFCLPNEKPAERAEPAPTIYLRWQHLVNEVRDMPPTTLRFDEAAKQYLADYERDIDLEVRRLSSEGAERMASYICKQNYFIRRYAAIVHVLGYNPQPTTITLQEVEYARRLVTFFAEGTKRAYDDLFCAESNEISDAEIVRIINARHHITERQKQSVLADIMEKSQQAISKNLK